MVCKNLRICAKYCKSGENVEKSWGHCKSLFLESGLYFTNANSALDLTLMIKIRD